MWIWAILAILWVAVLGPTLLRRFKSRQFSSVGAFRRLLTVGNGGSPAWSRASSGVPGAVIGFSVASQSYSDGYSPSSYGTDWSPSASYDETAQYEPVRRPAAKASVKASRHTAARRRQVMTALIASTLVFFLLGFIPGAGILWAVALLTAGLTATYIGLLVHFHRVAVERAQKVIAFETRRNVASQLDERRQVVASSGQGW
jgi:hypothetical protein